ncbi:MAG: hypothetical protein IKS92_15005 [Victivallales bacterium]|nr:hypothetical protein [Victivallales bacterium]
MTLQQYQMTSLVSHQPLMQMAETLATLPEVDIPFPKRKHHVIAKTRRMQAYERLEALRDKLASMKITLSDFNTERDEALREKYGE